MTRIVREGPWKEPDVENDYVCKTCGSKIAFWRSEVKSTWFSYVALCPVCKCDRKFYKVDYCSW